jgi:peptidoglycan/LPS O-acetylase OafA/YrhL
VNLLSAWTYLPALDRLRAVSIALVVLSHLGLERVVPGAFGVTLFFFISGYLITRQLGHWRHGGVSA